jgi:hypothetical protein
MLGEIAPQVACLVGVFLLLIMIIGLVVAGKRAKYVDKNGNLVDTPQYEKDLAESQIRAEKGIQNKLRPLQDEDLRMATEEYYADYGESLDWNEEPDDK